MSTLFFYHTFNTRSYKYIKTEYICRQTHVHLEKKKPPRCCKYCKHLGINTHQIIINYVKTIPIGLRETFLVLHLKRFSCQKHRRTFREKYDIADPRNSYSRKFARFVYQLSSFLTIVDICKLFKVKGGLVRDIIKKYLIMIFHLLTKTN
jgi:transposase